MSEQEKSNTAKREEEILKFWQNNKIFEKSLEKDSPEGEFVFYDGPPFATGLPHSGSLLSSVIKDVVPRYKTMQGYHVRRRWGWDCHGLPIESLVEKKLGLKTKKDILDIGIEKFNETARSMVLEYVSDWKRYVDRVGRWVDFDNSYKTMDNTYIESVWWALKKIYDDGRLYEGMKVLMYCPHCETPLAKAEIAMDNTYEDVTEEAVTIKFKIREPEKYNLPDNSYFLAWTTTPWTLPANTALAVGPDIDYGVYEKDDDTVVLATSRAEEYELSNPSETFKGKKFEGAVYEPLFSFNAVDSYEGTKHQVFVEDYVSDEDGTGVVHSGTIYGEEDYDLVVREKLPVLQLLDASANYNERAPEFIRGKFIKDAENDIKADLEKRGLLYEKKSHTHSYPHCYRCGAPLIYNAVSSWFIDIQSVKQRMLEENENVDWHPEHLKHGRFKNIVESAPDWTISRNRFWASPLPIWRNDETGEVVVIGSVEELKEKAIGDVPEDLHRPYIDDVKLKGEKGGELSRIPEVVDCWVESGSMPFAEYHYPFENENEFEKRSPGDFIAEYIAQTRTWFYYMHAMGVLLFDRQTFKNVVSTGTLLAEDGQKISKSKQNYTDPYVLFDTFGADAFRMYLLSSPLMKSEDLNFADKGVDEINKKCLMRLANVYSLYALYKDKSSHEDSNSSEHILDRWVVARFNQLHKEVTEHMEAYEVDRATKLVIDFVDDLSTWYARRSRDRLKGDDEADRIATLSTLKWVLRKYAKVLAPAAPFIAEWLWQEVKRDDDPESVHLVHWCSVKDSDEQLLADMQITRDMVSRALDKRVEAKMKVRQPLSSVTVNKKLDDEFLELIKDEVNVKEVLVNEKLDDVELDTELTDELKNEGSVRDLLRHIQDARKKAGLTPDDQATLRIETDETGKKLVEQYRETIEKTALLKEISFDGADGESISINGVNYVVSIS